MGNVPKAKKVKEPAQFVKERQELIKRLLSHKDKREINWIIEGSATKRLWKKYPFPEFWAQLNPPFELNSLTALCSQWGSEYLRKQYNIYLFLQINENIIEPLELGNKMLEKIEISDQKPSTLKKFLS